MVEEWSSDRKSVVPRRAATRDPQINVDAFQFHSAVVVGLRRANPACFTGRHASCLLVSHCNPVPKRDGKKFLANISLTTSNSSLSPLVTRWRNCDSCCRYFYRPACAPCGYLPTTFLDSSSTPSAHAMAFSSTHSHCSALSLMNPPRYQLLVTTLKPKTSKQVLVFSSLFSCTIKRLFKGSGKYPLGGPYS